MYAGIPSFHGGFQSIEYGGDMKRELACLTETQSHLTRGSAPGVGAEVSDEPNRHSGGAPANGNCDRPIVKVYQMAKKLKANGVNCTSSAPVLADSSREAAVKIEAAAEMPSQPQGNLRVEEERESSKSELVEVEVVQEDGAALEMEKSRRFTRSVMQFSAESEDLADAELEGLKDAMVLDSEVDDNGSTLSIQGKMKMFKNIEIRGRPTTVRELLETGLLEGYPVFYNGGNKGIPLRGTIKDIGILCSCFACKGLKTIAPCTFEIHACKSYRRATQYICLENGKSLLDVVKDCGRASLKDMRKAIQSIIGPLPEKESIMCRNCKSTFLATSAAKVDQLCDLCMISIKSVDSIMHTPYEKYRSSDSMVKDPPIPFEEGQLVETKSFLDGFRGAWFRAKIVKISWRGQRAGHVLDHLDYPDEEKEWTESYQVPPNPDGSSKKRRERVGSHKTEVEPKRQRMLRPAYPPIYHKDELVAADTNSEMIVVVDGGWRVDDLVDWLEDDCYWMGKLTEILDEEKATIELLPLPIGEGGTYVAKMSLLRPTLDWSPESGWTVPTPEGVADFHQRVQIIYPERQTVGCEIGASEEPMKRPTATGLPKDLLADSVRVSPPGDGDGDGDKGKQPEGLRNAGDDTAETTELPENLFSFSEKCDTLEAALMGLEEIANKLIWLKQILQYGYPLPSEASSSWEFVEHRG